jgi:hypothetical protein
VCGRPGDRMEGSLQLKLPNIEPYVEWIYHEHPYRRSYSKRKLAEWETNDQYCEEKMFQDILFHSKFTLDLMDLSLYDFLINNLDRHHVERLISLGDDPFPLHLDQGRSFGRIKVDDLSILKPISQCCLFRYSTLKRIVNLYEIGLSRVLDNSLKRDPLYPILTDDHLESVDRRLAIALSEIYVCTLKYGIDRVVIDDGY